MNRGQNREWMSGTVVGRFCPLYLLYRANFSFYFASKKFEFCGIGFSLFWRHNVKWGENLEKLSKCVNMNVICAANAPHLKVRREVLAERNSQFPWLSQKMPSILEGLTLSSASYLWELPSSGRIWGFNQRAVLMMISPRIWSCLGEGGLRFWYLNLRISYPVLLFVSNS